MENKFCNICGNKLNMFDLQEEFEISTVIGYGSKHDTERLNLRMCCSCMDKLIDACNITPVETVF